MINGSRLSNMSCFYENTTTSLHANTNGEICAEETRTLGCPKDALIYEIVNDSKDKTIFLRNLPNNVLMSKRCRNESSICTSCSRNSSCKTKFDQSRWFVMLDSTKTKVIKLFQPRIGLYCKCQNSKP